jgi:hypothetical protein
LLTVPAFSIAEAVFSSSIFNLISSIKKYSPIIARNSESVLALRFLLRAGGGEKYLAAQ